MLNTCQLATPIRKLIQNFEESASNFGEDTVSNVDAFNEYEIPQENLEIKNEEFLLKITFIAVDKENLLQKAQDNIRKRNLTSFGKALSKSNILDVTGKREMHYYFLNSLGYDWKQLDLLDHSEEFFKKADLEKFTVLPFLLFSSKKGLCREKLYYSGNGIFAKQALESEGEPAHPSPKVI